MRHILMMVVVESIQFISIIATQLISLKISFGTHITAKRTAEKCLSCSLLTAKLHSYDFTFHFLKRVCVCVCLYVYACVMAI